jgi:AAA domain, putative AbiEii toxin, Type IV TA system
VNDSDIPGTSLDSQLLTLLGHAAVPPGLKDAMQKSPGAQFYKCVFQLNSFGYLARHTKPTSFTTEASYNTAVVEACRRENVRVVSITDHFRIATARGLAKALTDAGIHLFPGFEASSSEGVHLLCLFPPTMPFEEIERIIGRCGVSNLDAASPLSDQSCDTLMELIADCGGLTIAAHVCSANGLLTTLRGQSCARVWRSDFLLAAALPGAGSDAPEAHRRIILNQDPNYRRLHPPAIINANDVSDPTALSNPSTTTWVKMSDISIEGLRQAFLDPESRIRLNSDATPAPHTELVAISWAGGLLDGQSVRLSEGLNVFVGGRGAGKSTLIESVRYAFDLPPKADDARRTHDAMMKSQLGQGAAVSVLVRSPHPSPQYYVIERIYGAKPRVRDHNGDLLDGVTPPAILGNIEVYGQHEISELTRQPDKLAELLRRFTEPVADTSADKSHIQVALEKSRASIVAEMDEIGRIDEALAALPSLRERLKRFAAVGLDMRLEEKTLIDCEARLFEAAVSMVTTATATAESVRATSMEGGALLNDDDKAKLPNAGMLQELNVIQATVASRLRRAASYIASAGRAATAEIDKVKNRWAPKQAEADQNYEKILRTLKTEGHDGTEFISIQTQVERLRPKEAERTTRLQRLTELNTQRRDLLVRWESAKAGDFRSLQQAARRVSRQLEGRVRVNVRRSRQLGQLETALRNHAPGNINQAVERLRAHDDLSLMDFSQAIREGASKLIAEYGFSQSAAEKIAQGGATLALEVEACDLPAEAALELNIGPPQTQIWKDLDELSVGQKATAVLLLLLLESPAPLIIDQPEDDLDNRFIAESIVPAMRQEKRRRQFIFSTHNANIPVLGDSEQIVGLTPVVEGGSSNVTVSPDLCGSIDVPAVKDLVKELLEGGQAAFEYRRRKYGF